MDGSIVVDFPSMGKASYFPSLESLLRDSTARFLAEVGGNGGGGGDLYSFRAIFTRLLHSSPDPPLEAVWFFSALSFHDSSHSPDSLAAIRALLQLLTSCSASCSPAKSIALLAPAVSELFHSVAAASKKSRREIEGLLEAVLSYISICSSKSSNAVDADRGCLLSGFGELVKVWSVRHSGDKCGFEVVFPLLGEEMRDRLRNDGCGVSYLAGAVVAEAFLLRLCLKVQEGAALPREELQKQLRIWAISSISVFQSRVFFEILLRMLLNPPLPVMSLLSAADEILARDVLYDALILVDYSFINHGAEDEQVDGALVPIFVTRLIITHDAVQDARSKGDQGRAMSHINAFSTSSIPSYLIKWVNRQVGQSQPNKPNAATPQALLKWLVDLEEKGLKVFEENISKLRGRSIFDEAKIVSDGKIFDSLSKATDAELFFVDTQGGGVVEKGEAVDMEMTDNAFMDAAQSMNSMTNGRRKRKDCGNEEGTKVKYVKYKIEDSSVKDYFSLASNGMSSGSEVENPQSDDEMEGTD